jgi:hypothetical protein
VLKRRILFGPLDYPFPIMSAHIPNSKKDIITAWRDMSCVEGGWNEYVT